MAVIEVASVLLLYCEPVCVVVARLYRELCYAGDAIVPGSVDLIDAMPD